MDQQYVEMFRGCGLRVTTPRKLILQELTKAQDYRSAEELFQAVSEVYPGIGLATVYRNLTLMTKMGALVRIEFGEGKARYGLAENSRDRVEILLVCDNCLRVESTHQLTEEQTEVFKKIRDHYINANQFCVNNQVLQVHGLCKECQDSLEAPD